MLDHMPPDPVGTVPAHLEAESAVLGSVLLDPSVMDDVLENMQPDDMFAEKHKVIFTAMAELYHEGEPIDLVTLVARLQDKHLLNDVGGIGYLTQLAGSTVTAANAVHYAERVREAAIERKIMQRMQRLLNDAATGTTSGLVTELQQLAVELAEETAEKQEVSMLGKVLMDVFEQAERAAESGGRGVTGLATGYPEFDRMTTGLHPGEQIIVAARPGVGKTAFSLNVAANAGKAGKSVVVFSLEMPAQQLAQRMLCAEAHIDIGRLRSGQLYPDDWTKMTTAIGTLSDLPVLIDDSAGLTVSDIRARCRRIKRERGLDLVIVDYLQLLSGRRRRNDNREQEVADISRTLKQIAKELEVPVIALSQLSRSVEQRQDKRPMLSDLRESGSIEQDADIVAFLYRDDYYDKNTERQNIIEIIIAKQRNGPVGTVELAFLKNFNKFVSLDRGHDEELVSRQTVDPRRQWA